MIESVRTVAGRCRRSLERLSLRSVPPAALQSPLLRYVDRRSLARADRLMRLGTAYGGWIIPRDSDLGAQSVCYCAGAGEDLSFDCELVRRFRCRVLIVDPTPRAIEHFRQLEESTRSGVRFAINRSDCEFYEIGVGELARLALVPVALADHDGELKLYFPMNPAHVSCSALNLQGTSEYFVAECCRVASLMSRMGDEKIDLMKMDIEGAEYSVIGDLVGNAPLPSLLLIEFDELHTPLDRHAGERVSAHIGSLVNAGMKCVAVEGSNATFARI